MPTRIDQRKGLKVTTYVQRQAVPRHAALHTHANSADLALANMEQGLDNTQALMSTLTGLADSAGVPQALVLVDTLIPPLLTQPVEALVALAQVDALLGRSRVLVMDMLIDPGTANIERRSAQLRGLVDEARQAWTGYRQSSLAHSGLTQERAQAFEPLFTAYLDKGLAPAAQAASEGRYDDTVAVYSDHIGPLAPQVAQAMAWLKQNYVGDVLMDELAERAHMSASTFRLHFRHFTGMSPLQYQKHLRLQQARHLMLHQALDAGSTAARVGYESASQFSREYSRLFGAPPQRDIKRMRHPPTESTSTAAH